MKRNRHQSKSQCFRPTFSFGQILKQLYHLFLIAPFTVVVSQNAHQHIPKHKVG